MATRNTPAASDTTPDAPEEEQTTKVVHRKVRTTRSGDTFTAKCTCGWNVSGDSSTVTRAKAVHLGQSKRDAE